ncbi:MAG: purine-binding chemotaxis protein CheW [Gemmatimonadaceae bacterium]|nr:purine-binding chemotaxis protein CheW [Gloeobacterales cyanobacterium ES-bin-141]
MLLFYLGEDRYALDTERVLEVIPRVRLTGIPNAPPHVAGIFNYRGSPVPVLDLCLLIRGEACPLRLGTRIVLVDYPDRSATTRIGLMVERITTTVRVEGTGFVLPSVVEAPYLDRIGMDAEGLIQHIAVERLMPDLGTLLLTEGS